MDILIDTNVFISREADRVVSEDLAKLENILKKNNVSILIHPYSISELSDYENEERRKIAISKVKAYPQLSRPPSYTKDSEFLNIIEESSDSSERVDNSLLYSVFKNVVGFLITEDKGLVAKAQRLGISNRVLSVNEALGFFQEYFINPKVSKPPALKEEAVSNINIEDHIFDSLRDDYGKEVFNTWLKRTGEKGRNCFVSYKDGVIGAIEIYKDENEAIDCNQLLPKNKRLKICTLKVVDNGYRIGELLLKLAIQYSLNKNYDEIYLTHYTKDDDPLVSLISEYGFEKVAVKSDGEEIFLKNLKVPKGANIKELSHIKLCKKYYPSFYDGKSVKKFIIPIRPEYHRSLFIDYPEGRQTKITEHAGKFIVEGNTIKKIYLTQSPIKKINVGDILIFYRSEDSYLTALGVVENVNYNISNPEELTKIMSNRTVYSLNEINSMLKSGKITAISFIWILYLKNKLSLSDLETVQILKGAPISITEISQSSYDKIKNMGGLDGSYTIN